jgi:hypothetical protein
MPRAVSPNTQDADTRRFWSGVSSAVRGRAPAIREVAVFLPVAPVDPDALDFADRDAAHGVILWAQVGAADLARACNDPRSSVRARARRERNRRIASGII